MRQFVTPEDRCHAICIHDQVTFLAQFVQMRNPIDAPVLGMEIDAHIVGVDLSGDGFSLCGCQFVGAHGCFLPKNSLKVALPSGLFLQASASHCSASNSPPLARSAMPLRPIDCASKTRVAIGMA